MPLVLEVQGIDYVRLRFLEPLLLAHIFYDSPRVLDYVISLFLVRGVGGLGLEMVKLVHICLNCYNRVMI